MGCPFPMVVVSILPHEESGRDNHREDAPHFNSSFDYFWRLLLTLLFFRLGFIGVMFFKYLNGLDRRHLVLSSLWFHSEFLQFTSLGVSLICGDLFDRELINFGLKINPFGIWVHLVFEKSVYRKSIFQRSSESLRYDL